MATYSKESMEAAKLKFMSHGRGLVLSSYQKRPYRSNTTNPNESLWADLCNPDLFSISSLKSSLVKLGQRIALQVDDEEIFGNEDTLFIHVTPRDEDIKFSTKECYLFLRAAILEQMNTKEYVQAKKEKARIENELETYKTKSERRKELREKLEKVDSILNA